MAAVTVGHCDMLWQPRITLQVHWSVLMKCCLYVDVLKGESLSDVQIWWWKPSRIPPKERGVHSRARRREYVAVDRALDCSEQFSLDLWFSLLSNLKDVTSFSFPQVQSRYNETDLYWAELIKCQWCCAVYVCATDCRVPASLNCIFLSYPVLKSGNLPLPIQVINHFEHS